MTTDRVFVLLMMVLLMMAGCFEATSTTEAEEEQDSTSGDEGTSDNVPNGDSDEDSSSNEPVDSSNGQGSDSTNSGTPTSNSQERTWYSSGGVYIDYWNDGQDISNGQERCIDYGPTYNSSTGEYMGENCRETAYPTEASDWNTSMCTDYGGTVIWDGYSNDNWSNDYRYAPNCLLSFTSINTNSGEALLIYQSSGFSIRSTCNGISSPSDYSSSSYNRYSVSDEYNIVPNSAFDCSHELYRLIQFNTYNYGEQLWSIVYAIQDTIVV